MFDVKTITGGAAVAALAWLGGTGVASAAGVSTTQSTVDTTTCMTPLPSGSAPFGNGTPVSADRAYLNLPSGASGQLAFTGGNLSKELVVGLAFIGGGAVILFRNGRRSVALVDDSLDA